MTRPCFLVIDREFSQSISTRKLVIETAKFNVLTAYSADEAIETIRRFPKVDGVVVDSDLPGTTCEELVRALKEISPKVPVIGLSTPRVGPCEDADYQLQSFDPRQLLALLEKLRPEDAIAVERRNEELKRKEQRMPE